MNCIDACEATYHRVASHYNSTYSQVEFSFKRIKFATATRRVDHHLLLVSYVTGRGFFGERWEHCLYDNFEGGVIFSRYDDVDGYIERKYRAEYHPVGTVELSTEPFYLGANTWEWLSGQDAEW